MVLSLEGAETAPPPTTRRNKFRIQDFTKDEWEQKNAEMATYLSAHSIKLANCEGLENLARFFDILVNGLKQVFKVKNGKKRSKCCDTAKHDEESQIAPMSPFHISRRRDRARPDYPLLMKAVMDKDRQMANEIMNRMVRGDWRSFLSTGRPSDTSAFVLYLARTEGRRPRRRTYPCRAPLMDSQGKRRPTGQAKCNVLADFFAERLKGTERQNPSLSKAEAARRETAQWRRLLQTDEFTPIIEVEVKKAVAAMAKKEAAGADGLAAELFQHLPRLLQPTVRLFNVILKTGRMPH